ncbi:MAG: hypothetical protein KGJ88_02100 [Verrucomicrobiota bacterium]|nr:hypothetical protein [Verrucomicrobiota bacterium]
MKLVRALKPVPKMAAALKNSVLALKKGLISKGMGEKSRKRPVKLNLTPSTSSQMGNPGLNRDFKRGATVNKTVYNYPLTFTTQYL